MMKKRFATFLFALLAPSILFAQGSVEGGGEESAPSIELLEQGMITLSKQMIEVTKGVKSVVDAEAAEPKVEKAMSDIGALFRVIADNIDGMTIEELKGLQDIQNIDKNPEVKEWMDKAEAAFDKLKADYPEAAEKLQEIGQKHGEKMMGVMMEVMIKISQKVGSGDIGDMDEYDSSADFGEATIAEEEVGFLSEYRQSLGNAVGNLILEIDQINSVEDVERAEQRIEEEMSKLTAAFSKLVESWEALSTEEQEEMGGVLTILQDPGIVEQLELIEDVVSELKERNREAGEALQEIGKKYSRTYEELMDHLMEEFESMEQD